MSQRANHLAWSVLFSPTGDIRSLTEGYLFIAIKKKHVPPMPETYQSGLGILQKENLVYKITLYNSGPVKTFVGISQSKNFLMISHGSRICYVEFYFFGDISTEIELSNRGIYLFRMCENLDIKPKKKRR